MDHWHNAETEAVLPNAVKSAAWGSSCARLLISFCIYKPLRCAMIPVLYYLAIIYLFFTISSIAQPILNTSTETTKHKKYMKSN